MRVEEIGNIGYYLSDSAGYVGMLSRNVEKYQEMSGNVGLQLF
jgi:hypothetical protein